MHSSTHEVDDLDWLLVISFADTYAVCGTSLVLTTDPPSDVDIEECENSNETAKESGDEIFGGQEPSRRRWHPVWHRGC